MAQAKDDAAYEAAQTTGDSIRGAKMGTKNYKMALPTTGNNLVNVIDKTKGPIRNGAPAGDWVARFDQPHGSVNYPHININPKLAKIPRDPHIKISPNTLSAAQQTGRALKNVNKVMVPLAVAMDGARIGYNAYDDYNKGTSRNTVESVAGVAGGWAGGAGGAAVGATIGTAILPGIGTIVGGVAGGISSAIGGSYLAEGLTSKICDKFQHDIVSTKCKRCGKLYQCRKYTNQSRVYCDSCANEEK